MKRYNEEKPLSKIIQDRKKFYEKKMKLAFNQVYQSRDFGYIESFETAVLELTSNVIKGGLEKKLKKNVKEKVDKRPRLTSYQFNKAMESGMTLEEIKEKFRYDSKQQLGGLVGRYNLRQRLKKETE